MNEKTVSEVGITHLHALRMTSVHKNYDKWSPSSPQPPSKSKRITEEQRVRQTTAVPLKEKASRQQKLIEKKKLEARSERGNAKAASTNPMAIPSKKAKISGEG